MENADELLKKLAVVLEEDFMK